MKDSLSYKEIPHDILHRQVLRLRKKEVASVKVLWRKQSIDGVIWEAEENMMNRHPHLFDPRTGSV